MIIDQFGNPIRPLANYSSTKHKLTSNWIAPRYNTQGNVNNFKTLDPIEKNAYHILARDLFRSNCMIRSAITRKNSWACGTGWAPIFRGTDQDYGKILLDYIINIIYPNSNVAGSNYSFHRTLISIANEIDVGGDCLVPLVIGRDGLLRMDIYPSSAIGQRNNSEKIVSSGRYKGNFIFDGVIYNSTDTPIAYAILAEKKDNDYYYSANNAILLFEPEEGKMFRGVSLIVSALPDAANVQDIISNLSRTIKLQSKMGIQIGTVSGTGEEYVDGYGVGNEDTTVEEEKQQPVVTDMGDFMFFDAKNNEGAKSFEPKQPGAGVAEWVQSLSEQVLYNLGWHLALISPGSIGSYASRIMESQVQQMISARQQTLKRIAKIFVTSAIARAIDNGDLPAPKGNSNDWRMIDFHMPPEFTIDSYYGAQTAMQQWTTGNASLSGISAKQGIDWIDLRNQRELEADDALTRADRLAKKWNLPIERTLDLISKQTVNASPVQSAPVQNN